MNIENSTFLMTGGTAGIGKATAKILINEGGRVAITGRDKAKLDAVSKEIGAFAIHADASIKEDVDKTYDLFMKEFERLDCLINNAGIGGGWVEITELDMKAFHKVYDVNVFGAAMMGSRAAQLFKKQNYGNIVNIASTAALKGYANGTIYSSSKFALRGMTQCWQADLRKYNVRVILVNPSEVTTAFGHPQRIERDEIPNKLRSEEIAHTVISTLKMDDRGFIPEVTIWATNPF
ncbi:MAG: SDR family oxidoreductase [Ignavibacteria bacterium]